MMRRDWRPELHQEASASIRMRLDAYLARFAVADRRPSARTLSSLCCEARPSARKVEPSSSTARARSIASSAPDGDLVVESAIAGLAQHTGPSGMSAAATEFRFDHVTAKPLSRETWLTYATTYREGSGGRHWILVTAMPEAFYLAGLRIGSSRSAMVFALALVLSLVLAAALASTVTAPLRRISRATQAMARGDLSTRVPGSKLEELGALAQSFNDMAGRLKTSFDDLVGEVETRKSRERELEESEARLRVSDDRLQLAIDAAGLGIWDWDVEQDRLVWDDSKYQLYGIRKDEFSGAFDAWSRCLVPEDVARATGDVEAALRGDREYRSDFRVRRGGRRHPHHSRRGTDHPQRGRPARAHGRHQPGCHGSDQRGARTRAARPRAAQAPGASRSARGQPHHRAARRQGGRGERQPGEERLPRQHVPRDPHADERDPRLRPAARTRPGPARRSETEDRHHPLQRQSSADVDQRHSGDVEDRGGPRDAARSNHSTCTRCCTTCSGCSAT